MSKETLISLAEAGISRSPLTKYCLVTYPPRNATPLAKDSAPVLEKLGSLQQDTETDLYIHVPYCTRSCTFCNFYFEPGLKSFRERSDAYVDSLQEEAKLLGGAIEGKSKISSVYLGGGSPSLLSPQQVRTVLGSVEQEIGSLSGLEVTLELHPEIVRLQDSDYLQQLQDIGITRISIGYQSDKDSILQSTRRGHKSQEAYQLLQQVKEAGFTTNVDLMWGFAEQSVEDHQRTLEKIISLDPESITTYFLEIRPNSPDFKMYQELVQERNFQERIIDMGIFNRRILEHNGFEEKTFDYWFRGEDFQHRKRKWGGEDTTLLSLGPGTYNWIFVGPSHNVVFFKPYDVNRWQGQVSVGNFSVDRIAKLGEEETLRRHTMFALRQGSISRSRTSNIPELEQLFDSLARSGLVEKTDESFSLTEAGKLLNHEIATVLSSDELLEKSQQNDSIDELKYASFGNVDFLMRFKRFLLSK